MGYTCPMILNEEAINLVEQRFVRRIERVNRLMLSVLSKRIRDIGQLSISDAYMLANSVEMGADINKITAELAKQTGKNIADIYPLYNAIGGGILRNARKLYDIQGIPYIPYVQNIRLQQQVKVWRDITVGNFINISKTTGFSLPDYTGSKIWYRLSAGYQHAIDQAVLQVSSGIQTYSESMYRMIRQYADEGIKTMDYPSGYSRRLDSAVRMNLLDGVRQVNMGIQDQIGQEIGANGVEISAHPLCAEDHLPYQGRQYTNEEYEQLNNLLERPIGTLNCRHFAFNIVLGISSPAYSKSQLAEFKKESNKKIEYRGKTYTKYEMTQLQRKIETAIRHQKDYQMVAKNLNDKNAIGKAQQNITNLTNEYRSLSRQAKIRTEMERMRVPGYRRVAISKM